MHNNKGASPMRTKKSYSKRDQRHPAQVVVDPICKMEISPEGAVAIRTVGAESYYFCSKWCAEKFDRQHSAPEPQ
jgi:YHS domain-containing protein